MDIAHCWKSFAKVRRRHPARSHCGLEGGIAGWSKGVSDGLWYRIPGDKVGANLIGDGNLHRIGRRQARCLQRRALPAAMNRIRHCHHTDFVNCQKSMHSAERPGILRLILHVEGILQQGSGAGFRQSGIEEQSWVEAAEAIAL